MQQVIISSVKGDVTTQTGTGCCKPHQLRSSHQGKGRPLFMDGADRLQIQVEL